MNSLPTEAELARLEALHAFAFAERNEAAVEALPTLIAGCREALRLRAEVERLRALLSDVAESGVEFDDERLRWLSVQIDRETWAQVQAR